jgi:hypothetical protein
MNRRISYLVIAIGLVFTSICTLAVAKKAKSGKPGSEMKLVSIDLPNNKITVSDPTGENITTLNVMQLTKVTLNGQPAKLSDLRPKMRVSLSVIQGGKTADKIDATDPPNKK